MNSEWKGRYIHVSCQDILSAWYSDPQNDFSCADPELIRLAQVEAEAEKQGHKITHLYKQGRNDGSQRQN